MAETSPCCDGHEAVSKVKSFFRLSGFSLQFVLICLVLLEPLCLRAKPLLENLTLGRAPGAASGA